MPKITMSIRTEPELKAKLEYIIQGSGMSLADCIKRALFQFIEKWERENGKIPSDYTEQRAAALMKERSR